MNEHVIFVSEWDGHHLKTLETINITYMPPSQKPIIKEEVARCYAQAVQKLKNGTWKPITEHKR